MGDLTSILSRWLDTHPQGTAAVIGAETPVAEDRVAAFDPVTANGPEFARVILCQPEAQGTGVAAAIDRHVAMTRTVRELVVLSAT